MISCLGCYTVSVGRFWVLLTSQTWISTEQAFVLPHSQIVFRAQHDIFCFKAKMQNSNWILFIYDPKHGIFALRHIHAAIEHVFTCWNISLWDTNKTRKLEPRNTSFKISIIQAMQYYDRNVCTMWWGRSFLFGLRQFKVTFRLWAFRYNCYACIFKYCHDHTLFLAVQLRVLANRTPRKTRKCCDIIAHHFFTYELHLGVQIYGCTMWKRVILGRFE